MKINKIAGALAFLAVAALSNSASASIYNISTPVDQLLKPYINFAVTPDGEFNDIWNFTISSTSSGATSVTNHQMILGTSAVLDIPDLKMSIYYEGALLSTTGSGVSAFSTHVLPGSYHAIITGNSTGLSGGAYIMSVTASPAPALVPVPAAAWLLGSGLIGLVAVARRKDA